MKKSLPNLIRTFSLAALTGLCAFSFNGQSPPKPPSLDNTEAKGGLSTLDRSNAQMIITPLDSIYEYNGWDRNAYQESINNCAEQYNKRMKDLYNSGYLYGWLSQFDDLRNEPLHEQLVGVNNIVNKYIKYTSDSIQYGKGDYWASPIETVLNAKGDCDDYALLKRAALRYLGVPSERLFLTLVDDLLDPDAFHAVLIVDLSEKPGTAPLLVLDNGYASLNVVPLEDTHLKPAWIIKSDNLVLKATCTDVPRPAVKKINPFEP